MLNAARAVAAAPRIKELIVPVPAYLPALGREVRATLAGRGNGPAVVVLGGISATSDVCGDGGWWPGVVGDGCAIDPASRSVLAVDFAADASGRIAPTTAEQAEVVLAAMDAGGIDRADFVGASYGGMVALSLAAMRPERVAKLVAISAGAAAHPMATAIRDLQRRTVALGLARGCGAEALAIARGWAMLSYRTREEFGERFAGGLDCADPCGATAPGTYLRARGEAFLDVMSPERFLSLSGSIDRHRVDPSRVVAPALLIGAAEDQLVPAEQMRALADSLGGPATLRIRESVYGHDMFLKDAAAMGALIGPFLS